MCVTHRPGHSHHPTPDLGFVSPGGWGVCGVQLEGGGGGGCRLPFGAVPSRRRAGSPAAWVPFPSPTHSCWVALGQGSVISLHLGEGI